MFVHTAPGKPMQNAVCYGTCTNGNMLKCFRKFGLKKSIQWTCSPFWHSIPLKILNFFADHEILGGIDVFDWICIKYFSSTDVFLKIVVHLVKLVYRSKQC